MNKCSEKNQKVLVKSSAKGRGGKDVEIRSKKHKNELHILKMSQEWDLRRQQRRLDRQKWVEERRNQKLPIWQRVGNLRVQANEKEILRGTDNEHVNKKERTKNSNEARQDGMTNDEKVKVKMKQTVAIPAAEGDPFRLKCSRSSELIQERHSPNQKRHSSDEIQFIKTEQQRTIKQPLQYNINTLQSPNVSAAQITGQVSATTFNSSSKVR